MAQSEDSEESKEDSRNEWDESVIMCPVHCSDLRDCDVDLCPVQCVDFPDQQEFRASQEADPLLGPLIRFFRTGERSPEILSSPRHRSSRFRIL